MTVKTDTGGYEKRRPKTVEDVKCEMRWRDTKNNPSLEHKTAFALERAVKRARLRAKDKNIPCDINFEWAMARVLGTDYRCEMTGIKFFDPSGDGHRTHPYTPTIDRIDTTLGYSQMNSRVVCCAFNVAFNEWGPDVFEAVSRAFQERAKALSR